MSDNDFVGTTGCTIAQTRVRRRTSHWSGTSTVAENCELHQFVFFGRAQQKFCMWKVAEPVENWGETSQHDYPGSKGFLITTRRDALWDWGTARSNFVRHFEQHKGSLQHGNFTADAEFSNPPKKNDAAKFRRSGVEIFSPLFANFQRNSSNFVLSTFSEYCTPLGLSRNSIV